MKVWKSIVLGGMIITSGCGGGEDDVAQVADSLLPTSSQLPSVSDPATETQKSESATGGSVDLEAVADALDLIVASSGAVPNGAFFDLDTCPWRSFPDGFDGGYVSVSALHLESGSRSVSCTTGGQYATNGTVIMTVTHLSAAGKQRRLEQLADVPSIPGPYGGDIYQEESEKYYSSLWMASDITVSFAAYAEARESPERTTLTLTDLLGKWLDEIIESG